ncbi:MAG: zinc ribbon domain-containing protein [Bryobacteraceae bacterium]|nr:zinc ribbon domain-containing protein [Bryobacteraceae bacterium]
MPAFCSCGAGLVDGARFCHKCGKPTFEEIEPEPAPVAAEIPLEAPPAAKPVLEVGFGNPIAVRTAFWAAVLSWILISFPVPLPIIWPVMALLGTGLFSVYLYQRRTGESLSVIGGARMGWLTGIFTFAISTVFFTLAILLISQQGGLSNFYREHLPGIRPDDPNIDKVLEYLQNPAGLATFVFLSLGLLFAMFTIFPTLGGALGAKVFERDNI